MNQSKPCVSVLNNWLENYERMLSSTKRPNQDLSFQENASNSHHGSLSNYTKNGGGNRFSNNKFSDFGDKPL